MKKTGLLFVLALLWCDYATAQTPYFQGKTIRIIVGYPAGSAHDLWGRLIATHINKYIPGSPATVVQNMPGAGSMTATNYVYNVAKPDGQTVVVNNAAFTSNSC
jgi:tripartite-type tricarboxylate transporter receptor subunit TctC